MNESGPGSNFQNFNPDFGDYKKRTGITSDAGGLLEGLWSMERDRNIAKLERDYPGIGVEFDKLIELLPDAEDPGKIEFPFASAVLRKNKDGKMEVLARSMNMVKHNNDSTQHAEVVVLQEAQRAIGDRHLDNCIILTTAQPCEMCAGAMRNCGIGTVVYGISQEEMKGKHVKFGDEFKPIRTVPKGVDTDATLIDAGIEVIAGYKHDEVLAKLTRFVGTFKAYYEDPDA
ncbi:TPA: hypothetical protein DEP94_00555 [Candidatus Nomurabacteria bacterium]|nr:hypothetical protein [Candidatus Nomurabacteria bacterium]